MNYNVDFFIEKFEAIPEEKWGIGRRVDTENRRCALGWCYPTSKEARRSESIMFADYGEAEMLIELFELSLIRGVGGVNNGTNMNYQQPTPKQRILAALYDIKSNQAINEVKEIIAEKRKVIERLTENV
jgi:hypothetical protein